MIEVASQMKSTLNFATLEYAGDLLLKGLFVWSQILGQPKLHIKVTVIYSPEFPRQCASPGFRGLPCKACHTV